MAPTHFLTLLLITRPLIHAHGVLQPRNPYYGGFALPGSPDLGAVNGCPAGTLTCADANNLFIHCCPMYTFCGPYGPGAYCCPTSEDCGSVVEAGLTCADPSWTLYTDAFDWCCTNDTIGLAESDGECQPTSISFPSSEYANTVSQANDAPPPTNWPGGTVPPGVSTVNPGALTSTSIGQAAKTSSGVATTTKTWTATATSSSTSASTTKSSVGSGIGNTLPFVGGLAIVAVTCLSAVLF